MDIDKKIYLRQLLDDVLRAVRQEAFEEAAAIRPPRALGNPPGGVWNGTYTQAWDDAVAAYAAVIKTRGEAK